MRNFVRLACRTFAIIVIASVLALAVHYYLRLRLLEHATVTIDPGKWVWVECKTDMFVATIEEVEADGIVVSVGSPPPSGLPCDVVGLRAQGKGKYFMPFRTVLGIRVDGQQVWSNPNSM